MRTKDMPLTIAVAAIAWFLLSPNALPADPSYLFATVAAANESASGVTFSAYMQPGAINDAGQATLAPAVVPAGESIFLWRNGLIKVVAAGDPLPGGGIFGYALVPTNINASGETSFAAVPLTYSLPLGLDGGVYRGSAASSPVALLVPEVTPAPREGVFYGTGFGADINNRRDVGFAGMTCSTVPLSPAIQWPCPVGPGSLAMGVYVADALGKISAVVRPGDPAPGSGRFDFARGPSLNESGAVAFTGHVFGQPCNDVLGSQSYSIFCAESVYVKTATGRIVSVAHQGQMSPAGRAYYGAYGPVLNSRGDIVFLAELVGGQAADADLTDIGVFLYTGGQVITIAKPGDPMPGGGNMLTAGQYSHDASLNNSGDIVFVATLDNGQQGLYVWRGGTLGLIVKTGTVIPGSGAIATLDDFGSGTGLASSMVSINGRGQIFFAATFVDGSHKALIATPAGGGH